MITVETATISCARCRKQHTLSWPENNHAAMREAIEDVVCCAHGKFIYIGESVKALYVLNKQRIRDEARPEVTL